LTTQLWISFGFFAVLVIFLIVAFWLAPKLTEDQRKMMRFFTALCAGMSGGFLSGAAIVEAAWITPTGKIALSGTAGFGLFFFVMLFYNKVKVFSPDDTVEFNIPSGSDFRQAADSVASFDGTTIDYQTLSPAELASPMAAGHISCKTFDELLAKLRLKTVNVGAIREYTVAKAGNSYRLTVK
jgi:hypothetical protein